MRTLLSLLLLLGLAVQTSGDRRGILLSKKTAAGGGGAPSFPSGFTAYWKFDDTDPFEDFYTGSDLASDGFAPDVVAGKINNCIDLTPGNFDYLTTGDSAALDAGTDVDFSVAGWIWSDSLAAERYVLSKANSGNGWEVCVNTSGNIILRRWAGGTEDYTSTGTIATGAWYHFAITYDQSNVRIYINGALDATIGETTDIAADTAFMECGRSTATGSGYWDGKLDELGVASGKALSGPEVSDLYNSGTGLQP